MARKQGVILDTGDPFPEMNLQLTNGEILSFPEQMGDGYSVVLFYRGKW